MTSFLTRMGAGFPGDVNRSNAGQTITPEAADPANPIPAYGVPVALNSTGTGLRPLAATDTAANVYGLLVREFPVQSAPPNTYGAGQSLSTPAVPPTQGPLSRMARGFMTINVNAGSMASAVKGAQAYAWTAATTTGHTQGNFEAAASAGNTIVVPGAFFRGAVDANGNCEIEYNL